MDQSEQHPLFIFHDFENTRVPEPGQPRAEWPLHLTVTPMGFLLQDVERDRAIDTITEIAEAAYLLEIIPGENALFGDNNDIPVTRITDTTGELHYFHDELIHKLGELGCKFTDLTYAHEHYSPHVSLKPHGPIITDAVYTIRSMSIGQKLTTAQEPNKVILKTIEL